MLEVTREHAREVGISGSAIVMCFCVGGAGLGAWLFVRFPRVGPRTLSTIVLSVLAVAAGLSLAVSLFDIVLRLGSYGVVLGLLAIVLPAITGAFWVAACVMRALAGAGPGGLRG